MRDLIILGTGVHALEMAEMVARINRAKRTWRPLGYLTLDPRETGRTLNGLPVLGTREALADHPRACLVPDNTWPTREPLPRERLVSLVDPTAVVSSTAQIGLACVIYPHCYLGLNARLGDYVFCLSGSVINHDDVLADNVAVTSLVSLAGSVQIGADTYLGQACTVRQGLKIGRNCMIGMGAVVVKDVPPDSVMAGNPARKIKGRPVEPGRFGQPEAAANRRGVSDSSGRPA